MWKVITRKTWLKIYRYHTHLQKTYENQEHWQAIKSMVYFTQSKDYSYMKKIQNSYVIKEMKKEKTKVRFFLHPEQLASKRNVNTNTVGNKEESHLYVLMLGLKLV